MKRSLLLLLAVVCVQSIAGCDNEDTCAKNITAKVTFWDNTCWGATIRCNGEVITPQGLEEGRRESICDIGPFSCDKPGVYEFKYSLQVGSLHECEYCSSSDDKQFCVPLSPECGPETIEITASGSAETGPHPMVCCPDDPDCI